MKTAIIGSNLKALADNAYGAASWLLQEDTQQKLYEMNIKILPYWPPYSPDLSPIKIVWAIMKRRVDKYKPTTVQELIQCVQYVWDNLNIGTINKLINNFTLKLNKCIANGGGEVRSQEPLNIF